MEPMLAPVDPEISALIHREEQRQRENIRLEPTKN